MPTVSNDQYVKDVLGPCHSAGTLPDGFERYMLSLSATVPDITEALNQFPDVWRMIAFRRTKYKDMCNRLVAEHEALSRTLLDEAGRGALRDSVLQARSNAREERFRKLREHVSVVSGKGYITDDELVQLVANGKTEGLSEEEVKDLVKSTNLPIKDAPPPPVLDEGLKPAKRKAIKNRLSAVGKRDLYGFLGLGIGSSSTDIQRAHEEKYNENKARENDDTKGAISDILGLVKDVLIDGDPRKYDAALLYEAAEGLESGIRTAAVDGVIDEGEYEILLAQALGTYGLTEEYANKAILSMAHKLDAKVVAKPVGPTVSCPKCGRTSLIDSGRRHCAGCGEALWVKCPGCGEDTISADKCCSNCGFETRMHAKVCLLTRQAELHIDDDNLELAGETLTELEDIWRPDEKTKALRSIILQRRKVVEQEFEKLDFALTNRMLRDARRLLVKLRLHDSDRRLADGLTAKETMQRITGDLHATEQLVREAQAAEEKGRKDDAATLYLKARALSSDLDEVDKGLARCPPSAPESLRARVSGGVVGLEWRRSPSSGGIEYLIERSSRPIGKGETEFDELEVTSKLAFEDTSPPIGQALSYRVCAVRGKARSCAVQSSVVYVVAEVANLKLRADDGVVTASWGLPAPNLGVRVFRYEGRFIPRTGAGHEVPLSGSRSFTDRDVVNDQHYTYRLVTTLDLPGGETFTSKGIYETCSPQQRPEQVTDLLIQAQEKVVQFTWTPPPRGEVLIVRSASRPCWQGKPLSRGEIGKSDQVVSETRRGLAQAELLPGKAVFYTPVTVVGEAMVAGSAERFVAIPLFEAPRAEHFGSYVQLAWTWPPGCPGALVAWRNDQAPTSPADAMAATQLITQGEYQAKGGFRVPVSGTDGYIIAVFPHMEVSGERFFGTPVHVSTKPRASVSVHYSVSRKRLGGGLSLELWASDHVPELPEAVLVARGGGIQPLRIEDGNQVLVLSGVEIPKNERYRARFSLDGIRTPTYVRLFFRNSDDYDRFKIVDPKARDCKQG